eukprot:366058-Chlamydomonas_euryale.AAC.9
MSAEMAPLIQQVMRDTEPLTLYWRWTDALHMQMHTHYFHNMLAWVHCMILKMPWPDGKQPDDCFCGHVCKVVTQNSISVMVREVSVHVSARDPGPTWPT